MEERPLECGACKHPPDVIYKAIEEGKIKSTCMCAKCPILQKKIGNPVDANQENPTPLISLTCSNCKTTAEMLRLGEGVGCPKCYELFEELLIKEMCDMNCMPVDPSSSSKDKQGSLHLGKMPENQDKHSLANQIESLNIALGEALAIENYERAANIRDQINALLGNTDGK